MNGLLPEFERLKNSFSGKFIITKGVKREAIDKPITIKRFELEVEHNQVDGSIIRLEEKDRRKVLQIPASAIEVGKLEPNPR